jgi:hypothetical protein
VTANLQATGGDCIDISAPFVLLNLNNLKISQNVAGKGKGIGIHVLSTATGTSVNGGADFVGSPGTIADFSVGVQNDAPRAAIFSFDAQFNVTGVVNNGANALFANFISSFNSQNGVINRGASGALFSLFKVTNSADGVLLTSAAAPSPPTSNVRLISFTTELNSHNGVKLAGLTNSDLEDFEAFANGSNGVLITGGGGNKLSDFEAGSLSLPASGNTGFGVTVMTSNANNLSDFETSTNGIGGVQIVRSNGNRIEFFDSHSNSGGPGVWLNGSAHNTVSDFNACANSTSGIYIGCSSNTRPSNSSCGAAPHSNDNVVIGGSPMNNKVGIGIDLANGSNRLIQNDAVDAVVEVPPVPCNLANSSEDLEDDNSNCGSDLWILDLFASAAPNTCIH